MAPRWRKASPPSLRPRSPRVKMVHMKREIPTQLTVGVLILLIGSGLVAGEYFLVKWYPRHHQRTVEKALKLLPYRNDGLGIQMQVAAGIYGKVESFPGGVKIVRPMFWSIGPSLTITSQPNPDETFEFSPQVLAKWQTQGTYEEIPRFHFEHTKINNRDTVLTWQYKDRAMVLTARVLSPERLIEISCSTGRADEDLYMQACESSVHTLKVAGPELPPPAQPVLELTRSRTKSRTSR
jgi:hypothetical protein